jgi:sugar diacid utilization regulator
VAWHGRTDKCAPVHRLTVSYVCADTEPVTAKATPDLRAWLRAIGSVTAAVNAAQDLKSLLDLVAGTAHDLLDLSFCAIMLPDEDKEYLWVAGASGLPDQYIARVNRDRPLRLEADPTEGAPASRAFKSGKPCMVGDIGAEPPALWTELALSQGYESILVVPLRTGAGVVGTLNSYRPTPHEFSTQEIEQLELLAEHAAIALTSARVLDDLRDQHRLILRSEEIHDRLLTVAVRSGGVTGIATALHDLLGCPVLIHDAHGATLAAQPATAEAPDGGPAGGRTLGEAGLVRAAGEHVTADVTLDGTKVATVWLLDHAELIDAFGIRATEHASLVLSLEILRQRTAAEVEQNLRGELLTDLPTGADPLTPAIRDRAALMGHNLALPHRMLVAAAAPRTTPSGPAPTKRRGHLSDLDLTQRAATEAVRLTTHHKPRPLIAAVRGTLVALWPDTPDSNTTAEQLLRRAFNSAHRGTTAAIAHMSVTNHDIPAAYRTAKGALTLAATNPHTTNPRTTNPHTTLTLDDLGAAGLLLQYADPHQLRRHANRTLATLHHYDTDHDSQLITTLRTYLDHNLDRRTTADHLVLHPNTVSQLLRRIETLTGLDLHHPRHIIEARTALLLSDIADASNTAGDRLA